MCTLRRTHDLGSYKVHLPHKPIAQPLNNNKKIEQNHFSNGHQYPPMIEADATQLPYAGSSRSYPIPPPKERSPVSQLHKTSDNMRQPLESCIH
ncbi:hypothetical protein K0M31_011780 [Melipona bicolor]|uniref:Uncharacterized protein n=1 Tax=Melipona bicolor TaxID=60889 RepID=A0AA40GA76_9HYME|nr:hypothetical protein K0M31_011780 [Melipona bicolor]